MVDVCSYPRGPLGLWAVTLLLMNGGSYICGRGAGSESRISPIFWSGKNYRDAGNHVIIEMVIVRP